jgi:hypothetical protein
LAACPVSDLCRFHNDGFYLLGNGEEGEIRGRSVNWISLLGWRMACLGRFLQGKMNVLLLINACTRESKMIALLLTSALTREKKDDL